MKFLLPIAVAATALTAVPASATVTTLTFDGNICGASGTGVCGNGSQLGTSHGSTAEVAVSYLASGNSGSQPFASFWTTGYGDISNVIYANIASSTLAVAFAPTSGFEVRLLGFTAGCFLGRSDCQSLPYSVSSAGFSTIAGTATPTGAIADIVSVNSAWSGSAISLLIGPNMFNGALDNIAFESRAIVTGGVVPEPASWAMLIAGFGLIGAVARRRRMLLA